MWYTIITICYTSILIGDGSVTNSYDSVPQIVITPSTNCLHTQGDQIVKTVTVLYFLVIQGKDVLIIFLPQHCRRPYQ